MKTRNSKRAARTHKRKRKEEMIYTMKILKMIRKMTRRKKMLIKRRKKNQKKSLVS